MSQGRGLCREKTTGIKKRLPHIYRQKDRFQILTSALKQIIDAMSCGRIVRRKSVSDFAPCSGAS